ncbi:MULTISPECIES: DUF2599 domain-containing protein [unclassified Pseudofrankia]|uniref:DUF2599 domain-containing protein n=1 Tax=unclassified Pseudofrankia TaxID=2994372 RepID=UPI0009F46AE5|nr:MULTISPECIES: DUF2599 domain-containing protein [unclassified Pseudofrankia]MDT3439728.1 DUF2599 domain-containing protein [Pseudofrankia sp. BMG5.37]
MGKAVSAGVVAAGLVLASAVTVACQSQGAARSTAAPRSAADGAGASSSPSAAAVPSATASPAGAAAAGPPYCGASQYVEEITVQRWSNGDFRVSLRPTGDARHASDRNEATTVMWQAIRRCLTPSAGFTGLDGPVSDSLQDQLRCHEYLALVPASGGQGYATGETFDVESWRPKAGQSRWFSTKCGNTLGTDPSGTSRTFRPDGVQPQQTVTGEHE